MAVPADDSASAENGAHVNHRAFSNDRADVDDCAHHDDRAVADFHPVADNRARLNARVDLFDVQQRKRTVAAVVFDYHVLDSVAVALDDRRNVLIVADDHRVRACEHMAVFKVQRAARLDIGFYGRLFLCRTDCLNDFVRVHQCPPNKTSSMSYSPGSARTANAAAFNAPRAKISRLSAR